MIFTYLHLLCVSHKVQDSNVSGSNRPTKARRKEKNFGRAGIEPRSFCQAHFAISSRAPISFGGTTTLMHKKVKNERKLCFGTCGVIFGRCGGKAFLIEKNVDSLIPFQAYYFVAISCVLIIHKCCTSTRNTLLKSWTEKQPSIERDLNPLHLD